LSAAASEGTACARGRRCGAQGARLGQQVARGPAGAERGRRRRSQAHAGPPVREAAVHGATGMERSRARGRGRGRWHWHGARARTEPPPQRAGPRIRRNPSFLGGKYPLSCGFRLLDVRKCSGNASGLAARG